MATNYDKYEKKIGVHYNFTKNQIKNVRIDNVKSSITNQNDDMFLEDPEEDKYHGLAKYDLDRESIIVWTGKYWKVSGSGGTGSTTYEVSDQMDILTNVTDIDYDVAINERIKYEPVSDKDLNVYLNGVEVDFDGYIFASKSSVILSTSTFSIPGNNRVSINTSIISGGNIGNYIELSGTSSTNYRQVISSTESGGNTIITYSGNSVSSFVSIETFNLTHRDSKVAKKNDFLLWKGSEVDMQLDETDYISLEYRSIDSSVS